jgi:CubicO group peptidase (beta-lactamase class C family)
VIATTTAVLQLAERGRLNIESPVSTYWPAFASGGKRGITVRDLLTHYSGLRAGVDPASMWSGYSGAMRVIAVSPPLKPHGTEYQYSDQNFLVLGEVVRRVSGLSLDEYCERHIFAPLGMSTTTFHVPRAYAHLVASTGAAKGGDRAGIVHDPTARRMGGVAGHAGLFSTARDLQIFARMLLAGGQLNGARILSRESIAQMAQPQTPIGASRLRGFGWDLAAPLASNREERALVGSYGHTGYTGTMMWIDPVAQVYVIVLSNRTHPDGRGDAQPLRDRILELVSRSLGGAGRHSLLRTALTPLALR